MAESVIVGQDDPQHNDMALAWNREGRPRDFQFAGRHWEVYTEGLGFKFVAVGDPSGNAYGSMSTSRLDRLGR